MWAATPSGVRPYFNLRSHLTRVPLGNVSSITFPLCFISIAIGAGVVVRLPSLAIHSKFKLSFSPVDWYFPSPTNELPQEKSKRELFFSRTLQSMPSSMGSDPYQAPSKAFPAHPRIRQHSPSVRHNRSMPVTIPVAHDFNCEWCWIGLHQIRRLKQELDVEIEWLPYELYPAELGWPEPKCAAEEPPNKPKKPTRFELALAAAGMEMPPEWPKGLNTNAAHHAVEYAKRDGVADELVDRIYNAVWRHGLDVGDTRVLAILARGLVKDVFEMMNAIEEKRYADRIVLFDEPAYASGVYNLPTFFIGGKRYAEQPYEVLRRAVEGDREGGEEGGGIYQTLDFPPAPEGRPYVFINMVTTIDGKTVSGERTEHVADIGTHVDHLLMRRIEAAAQGVMLGAGSLRSTPKLWYPKDQFRIVVTNSGNLDFNTRFFTDAPEKAFVACSESASMDAPERVKFLRAGKERLDLRLLLEKIRTELGVERLLVEGGSELNAQLLQLDLVDELFLTLAPKVKLGRGTPTYAGGEPLPRERMQNYRLLENHRVKDELFLRYRREV
jgi:riboflavin biosynthesis pyrimidine reductase/predicted DsbA family dithiol-disulfide isomerase